MVLEIDEAGVLEAFQDSVSSLLLGIGVAREECGEVDELYDVRRRKQLVLCEKKYWNFQVILRDCRVNSNARHCGRLVCSVYWAACLGVCGVTAAPLVYS